MDDEHAHRTQAHGPLRQRGEFSWRGRSRAAKGRPDGGEAWREAEPNAAPRSPRAGHARWGRRQKRWRKIIVASRRCSDRTSPAPTRQRSRSWALIVHTAIEEEIFYPACREALPQDQIMDTAQVEHDGTKILIADLLDGDGDDSYRDAKVEVLAVQGGHHAGEEEKPKDGIFAQAAQHGVDTDELANRLLERKQALQRRAAELRPTRAVSLQPVPEMEDTMARGSSNERERDERGRFVSDDDDDDRRSSRRSRSRDDDEDDRGGRGRGRGGWFGDSEGHSGAARERYEDDDRGGRGGGGRGRPRRRGA